MSNLEELNLCLSFFVRETFIDGNHLKTNIINCMPRLNHLTFSVNSFIRFCNEMDFPSTEDIQRTFIDFPCNNIISYVDYFPDAKRSQCHIYSYPYLMEYYSAITNK